MNLHSPKDIKALMKKYDIAPLKQLGQNFLIDANALRAIAQAPEQEQSTPMLEIGPGLGALTRELAQRSQKVVAVEIDKGLLPLLEETLADCPNVEVVNADILECDLAMLHEKLGGGEFCVCANLPYYITTPIIMMFLRSGLPVKNMVFLIQKEVAERMAAKPSTKSYGSLSIAVQYYTDVEVVTSVPPTCFVPAPDVQSAVVRLTLRPPTVCPHDIDLFFRLVKAAFAMRRKTLANNLVSSFCIDRLTAISAITAAGLSETVRGEALGIEQFSALSDALGIVLSNNANNT